MSLDKPKKWYQWLTLAEWWYNTHYHTSLKITPFEALYEYPPSQFAIHQSHLPFLRWTLSLKSTSQMAQLLQDNLIQA